MITNRDIQLYQGSSLSHSKDSLYVLPHILLRPYISCYTFTFPQVMSDNYTILPTASARFILSVANGHIHSGLVGVNTKIVHTGNVNKMDLLVLIEFHSGCLYPFINIPQSEFLDASFDLYDIDKPLAYELETELVISESIEALIHVFNSIFISKLTCLQNIKLITAIKNEIRIHNGNISLNDISTTFHYSEKHIRRMFTKHIGVSPKLFSRIVRINHVLHLLQDGNANLTDIATQAGYFDQSHFIHDFKHICGSTPQQYIQNMSDFYNDTYKV